MPASAADFLRELRVDEIMKELQDVRKLPQPLVFLNRLKQVPADNRELIAKQEMRVQIAPMIATNAKAPVFQAQRFHTESNTLGKIKYGTHMDEDQMESWLDLINSPIRDPQGILAGNTIRKMVADQQLGIWQRMEFLAIAMALDGQLSSAALNTFGFILNGVTWGRYSDLKITSAIPWEGNPATATPVDDILYARQYRRERYGKETKRITMPTQALRAMILTTNFQHYMQNRLPSFVTYSHEFSGDTAYQEKAVAMVLDMELVLYDGRFETQAEDGTWSTHRFVPMSTNCPIVLDDPADDMNASVQDFGMGMAMEGRLSELMGDVGAGARPTDFIVAPTAAGARRPISYAYIPGSMDPVGLTVFSVAKVFPRLYNRASNAVLNIGPLTDLIPVTDLSPV